MNFREYLCQISNGGSYFQINLNLYAMIYWRLNILPSNALEDQDQILVLMPLSEDGKTVFQCKFHQEHQRTCLFSDPKNEAKKIKRYKNRDDTKTKLWKNVEKWVLMTNLKLNPQGDFSKWEKEIKPLFQDMGIEAELWSGEKLSSFIGRISKCAHEPTLKIN